MLKIGEVKSQYAYTCSKITAKTLLIVLNKFK